METQGQQKLSRPLASIRILEATHFYDHQKQAMFTKGKYEIIEVFNPNDKTIHFESYKKVK